HVLVKAGLFLLADELETRSGETDLRSIRSALGNRKGVALAATFLLLGLSLSGIPPFSGFIAKVVLFRAALDVGSWVLVGVLLVASLGTLASMLKIWRYVFADGPDLDPGDVEEKKGAAARTLPSVALLALLAMTLGVALFAGVIWDHAVETASQLQNVEEYVRAVSSAGTRGLSVNGEWQR
ncbi:MAG: hypothetical protein KDA27_28460, partial [Candidatus Eisenbacteria bacterium]|nr:hypothetical protein [Candidatus Eisenbacteria bacterium]